MIWQGKYLRVQFSIFYSQWSVTDILPDAGVSSRTTPFQHCAGNNKTWRILNHSWPVSIAYPAAPSSCLCLFLTSTHFHSPYNPAESTCVCVFVHNQEPPVLIIVFYLFDLCMITGLVLSLNILWELLFACMCKQVWICFWAQVCVSVIKRGKARRMYNGDSCSRHLRNNQRVSAQFPVWLLLAACSHHRRDTDRKCCTTTWWTNGQED